MKKFFKTIACSALFLATAMFSQAQDATEFSYAQGTPDYIGYGRAGKFFGAIKIDNPDFAGAKVMGFKVTGLNSVPDIIVNYKMWSATELPKDAPKDAQAVDLDGNGTITCNFSQPVTIGQDGLYLGYNFEVTDCNDKSAQSIKAPYPYIKAKGLKNSMFVKMAPSEWADMSADNGALTIVAFISTPDLKVNAVEITDLVARPLSSDGRATVAKYLLTNHGTTPVQSIEYTYTLEGKTTTETKNIKIQNLNGTYTLPVTYPAVSGKGLFPTGLKITKVNGAQNVATVNEMFLNLCIPVFNPTKRVLMEEATGTWCGWCTRGWLAMRQMNKLHPDDFVAAAYHQGDVMDVAKDGLGFDFGGGYPGCSIDRTINGVDPFFGSSGKEFGIENSYKTQLRVNGYGDIDISTKWANAQKTQLDVTSIVKLGAASGGQMKLGYVLIQNGICKPDNSNFTQGNYYAMAGYGATSGMLMELNGMGTKIKDIVFDDVVINCDYHMGVDGSLPAPKDIKLETPFSHNISFKTANIFGLGYADDPDNNLAVDPDNMEVVVMLIGSDGKICNSRKVKAGTETVAINDINVDNDDAEPVYFDLMGRQVANPSHGIFIKKQGNQAKKVLM